MIETWPTGSRDRVPQHVPGFTVGSSRPPAEPDAELIGRVLAGERELFHELVGRHERTVHHVSASILNNQQEAEDVTQETMLKALKNLHSFRGESKFSTWLLSIAVNEARMRLRHERILKFQSVDNGGEAVFSPVDIPDMRELPLRVVERKELWAILQHAIYRLPPHYRSVLLLRDVQELTIAETAAALAVSRCVVKTRLFRARIKIRKILSHRLRYQVALSK
jgi:RNA polymerase sigma-70 factor (ECF subfamily)